MARTQPLALSNLTVCMIDNLRLLHNIAPRCITMRHMACGRTHPWRMLAPRTMTRMKINSREIQIITQIGVASCNGFSDNMSILDSGVGISWNLVLFVASGKSGVRLPLCSATIDSIRDRFEL